MTQIVSDLISHNAIRGSSMAFELNSNSCSPSSHGMGG